VTTDYVWIIEDDVVPPDDACERLLRIFDSDTVSVSGVYDSRYDGLPCVWNSDLRHYPKRGQGIQMVHGNGFGCVVLRGGYLRKTVFQGTGDFDRVFYRQLFVSGLKAKVDWGVSCEHKGSVAANAPITVETIPMAHVPVDTEIAEPEAVRNEPEDELVKASIRVTACQCIAAGWCDRHQCRKNDDQVKLCQTHPDQFALWEQGAGPGQVPEPSLLRKGMNFGKAIVRHLADGGKSVGDAEYAARLATCRECDACDQARMVCRDRGCGCFLAVKARWESETCPRQKWATITDG
jgi:hypothetical protein